MTQQNSVYFTGNVSYNLASSIYSIIMFRWYLSFRLTLRDNQTKDDLEPHPKSNAYVKVINLQSFNSALSIGDIDTEQSRCALRSGVTEWPNSKQMRKGFYAQMLYVVAFLYTELIKLHYVKLLTVEKKSNDKMPLELHKLSVFLRWFNI